MSVAIVEGNKAERIANALELIAMNGGGQASADQSWYAVRNFVRKGLGPEMYPVGAQFQIEKENSLTASLGAHTGITGVTIDEETFLAAEGIVGSGVHEFTYDGGAWQYEGETINLNHYGLTVTGTAAEGDEIIVTEAYSAILMDVVDHWKTGDGIDAYSSASTYDAGSMVTYDGSVWLCTTQITTAESWTAVHWTKLCEVGKNRMYLMMHHCIYGRAFDAAEAAYYTEAGVAAGDYYFTSADGATYYPFTLANAVPAGGQIGLVYTSDNITGVKTFSSENDTTGIETAATAGTSTLPAGTSLGAFAAAGEANHTSRCRYGSNNYAESDLRKWINSAQAANAWWNEESKYDRKCGYANVAGLLHGMDADFLSVVAKTKIPCKTNNTYENDGWTKNTAYVVDDKFFLASRDELGYGKENVAEGRVFGLYDGAANADRIKYDLSAQSTARRWFHRSPYPGVAYYVRRTYTDGSLDNNCACLGYGAAAACIIE